MAIKAQNKQVRYFDIESQEISEDKELLNINFSSETPYPRYFGEDVLEVIGHEGYMDLSRLNNKAMFLFNHNWDEPLGVIEKAWIQNNKGFCEVRLSSTAGKYATMIEEKILTKISFGYEITDMEVIGEQNGLPLVKVYNMPFEVSAVTVPADDTACILSRSNIEDKEISIKLKEMFDNKKSNTKIENITIKKENKMDKDLIEILTLGKKFNQIELASDFVSQGKSLQEFNVALMETLQAKGSKLDGGEKREMDKFSFGGYLNEMASGVAGANSGLGKELTQDAIMKGFKSRGGIILPRSIMQNRATGTNSVGTAAAFGNTASNKFVGQPFDALYNKSVWNDLSTYMGNFTGYGSVTVPIINSKNNVQMLGEGVAATASRQETGSVTFTPKTAKATAKFTRELTKQSSLSGLEAIIMSGLVKAMQEKRNQQWLNGSGTAGEVDGLFTLAGTNAIANGTNGAALTFAKTVEFETDSANSNAELMRCGYISNNKVAGALKTTQKFASFGSAILENGMVNGYDLLVTNEVASNYTKGSGTNLSGMAFVNADWVHVAEWDSVEYIVNPYIEGDGAVRIEAFDTFDVQFSRPSTMSVSKDIVA